MNDKAESIDTRESKAQTATEANERQPELNLLSLTGATAEKAGDKTANAQAPEEPKDEHQWPPRWPSFIEAESLGATDQPVPRTPAGWHKDHDALVKKAETTNAPLLFYGDSITAGMTEDNQLKKAFGDKAENFGIVGDSTQHLLWRLQNGETNLKTEPKEVVLLIGANNIGAANKDNIVKGILADLSELNKDFPHAKVLVLGVLPQGKTTKDPRREEIKELNTDLAKELNGKANVTFFDVGPLMLEKDGSMGSKTWWGDGLHPRDYTPMFSAIKPILSKMTGS